MESPAATVLDSSLDATDAVAPVAAPDERGPTSARGGEGAGAAALPEATRR